MGKGGSKLTEGYHVLKVLRCKSAPQAVSHLTPNTQIHPSSPAEKAGLVPFFDFITSANNILLVRTPLHLRRLVAHASRTLKMSTLETSLQGMKAKKCI